jgi:hypothetical protein
VVQSGSHNWAVAAMVVGSIDSDASAAARESGLGVALEAVSDTGDIVEPVAAQSLMAVERSPAMVSSSVPQAEESALGRRSSLASDSQD